MKPRKIHVALPPCRDPAIHATPRYANAFAYSRMYSASHHNSSSAHSRHLRGDAIKSDHVR